MKYVIIIVDISDRFRYNYMSSGSPGTLDDLKVRYSELATLEDHYSRITVSGRVSSSASDTGSEIDFESSADEIGNATLALGERIHSLRIIRELKDTEKAYINRLERLINSYLTPLEEILLRYDVPSSRLSHLASLFGYTRAVHVICGYFMSRLNDDVTVEGVLKAFQSILPLIAPIYSSLAYNFALCQSVLDSFRTSTNEVLHRVASLYNLLTQQNPGEFDSLLIEPIQRVPRYILLVKELLKVSPNNFESDLLEVLDRLMTNCNAINSAIGSAESRDRKSSLRRPSSVRLSMSTRSFSQSLRSSCDNSNSGKSFPELSELSCNDDSLPKEELIFRLNQIYSSQNSLNSPSNSFPRNHRKLSVKYKPAVEAVFKKFRAGKLKKSADGDDETLFKRIRRGFKSSKKESMEFEINHDITNGSIDCTDWAWSLLKPNDTPQDISRKLRSSHNRFVFLLQLTLDGLDFPELNWVSTPPSIAVAFEMLSTVAIICDHISFKKCSSKTEISAELEQYAPLLEITRMYAHYITPALVFIENRHSISRELSSQISTFEKHNNGHIDEWLTLPMGRVLYLAGIVDVIGTDEQKVKWIRLSSDLETSQLNWQGFKSLMDLELQFAKPQGLASTPRELIREGIVLFQNMMVRLHLLSDCLCISKILESGKLKLLILVDLEKCILARLPFDSENIGDAYDVSRVIVVEVLRSKSSDYDSIMFETGSQVDLDMWIKYLNRYIKLSLQ